MRPYVLVWHPLIGNRTVSRKEILDALNTIPEVLNWRAAVGTIFLISEQTSPQVSDKIRAKIPGLLHVVVPVDMNITQGWADKDTWDFLTRPRRAGQP